MLHGLEQRSLHVALEAALAIILNSSLVDDHVRVPDLLWARELKDPKLVRFGDGEGVLVGVRRRPGGHESKRESQSAFRVETKKKNLVVQVTGGKANHTFWGRSP